MDINRSHPTGAWDLRVSYPGRDEMDAHIQHQDENVIQDGCEMCAAEMCPKCLGTGYINQSECNCNSGRTA